LFPHISLDDKDQVAEIKKLLTGFESLGYNCEFGLLQRKFGGEPLGLLRFSSTFPGTAVILLKARFRGLGEIDHMILKVAQKEYCLAHAFTNWIMHTGTKLNPKTDTDKMLKDKCKQIGFLRSKLIDDLESQNKIFVYQKPDLKDSEIDAIYEAVQVYGPCMLMCVRLFDEEHPRGSIEWRTDRLMVAAIDRAGLAFAGAGWDLSLDYWVQFCRTAQARWHELRQGSATIEAG
jgi:hypothetical protein